jgi:1,4-alpha-glucan branching enzyme
MVTEDGLRRDAVRAMVTADGTHAPWLRRYVNTWRKYKQPIKNATVTADGLRRDAVRAMVTADLQQMEHTHRGCVETCMLGKTPSAP